MKLTLHTVVPMPSNAMTHAQYQKKLKAYLKNCELMGISGVLLYFNHKVLDPWAQAVEILKHSRRIVPLIALQPYTMHPLYAAQKMATLHYLYKRQININVISGADESELGEIGNQLSHSERYLRLEEYVDIIRSLFHSKSKVSYTGNFYQVNQAQLPNMIRSDYCPQVYIAGSSVDGLNAAVRVGNVIVSHPEPLSMYVDSLPLEHNIKKAVRLGVIARETKEDAWKVAFSRFPRSRTGDIYTRLKLKSESHWNRTLASLSLEKDIYDDVYWTGGFSSGLSVCPFLVGSYKDVADYLQQYINLGVSELLLPRIVDEDDWTCIDRILTIL